MTRNADSERVMDLPSDPRELLTAEDRAALQADLERMARQRRAAEVEARNLEMP
ncbi:MAG TPA: hypothetical protein VLL25_18040 [Acidimicrobiales bacterium]|nr:hypothetical protein [Acidimicrobiales bacterium]